MIDAPTTLALIGLAIGGIILFKRLLARKEEDSEAFEWSTRREPLVFISEHPYDRTVESRYLEAIEKLQIHGNKYLTEKDVWLYLYRVHTSPFEPVEVIERNHSTWQDSVWREVAAKKAQWKEMKVGYIRDSAGQTFANQVKP